MSPIRTLAVLALLLCSSLARADDPIPPAEAAAIEREIERLESRTFSDREAASAALIKRGRRLLQALGDRPPHRNLEVRQRLALARAAVQQRLARAALPEAFGEGIERAPLRKLVPMLNASLAHALGGSQALVAHYQSDPIRVGPNSTRRAGCLRRVLVDPLGAVAIYDPGKQSEAWEARVNRLLCASARPLTRAAAMQRAQAFWQLACMADREVNWSETPREGGGWVISGLARHYYSKTPPWKERVSLELDGRGRIAALRRTCPGLEMGR